LEPEKKNWPADRVERWSIDRLIPYARNARTHSEAQVAQIAASMREWGWTNPILVDEAGNIIAGHGRLLAARQLGYTDAPVMVAEGWSDAKRRAYVIADNKLAMNADWDMAALSAELLELNTGEFDLGLTGFSGQELEQILAWTPDGLRAGLTDPDAAPEVQERSVSVVGDLWVLGKHRLLCGDSTVATDVERVLGGVVPHLMVTDPPYGVEYDPEWRAEAGVNKNKLKMGKVKNDDRVDWREAWALFPGDVVYCWHAGRHASAVQASLEAAGFDIRCQVIWAKDRFALSRGHYHWQHEPCWYAVRDGRTGHWSGDRSQSTLWEIKAREDGGQGHGTQKPVECMRRPMQNNSSIGQAVYEPFCGSGTSIIAAEQIGRSCHAIELSPNYVDVGVKRWQEFTGTSATLDGDGRTFDEVSQGRV
jgi:DNA modification methylase